jgi:hypothetical protein
LPEKFKALKVTQAMDDAWIKLLKDNNIGAKKDSLEQEEEEEKR